MSRLEIFFDLVFVYGFFNISRFLVEDLNAGGLIKGLLVLALLWLCWIGHILVAHRIRLGEGVAPLVSFAAMGAALAIALAIPHAFADMPGGIYGPLLFPIFYFLLRSLHLGLHMYAVRQVPEEYRLLVRVGVAVSISTGLLLLAAALPWLPGDLDHFGVRVGLWALAVLVEYGSALVIGLSGWRLASPTHFVERFELIIIIAFGELIISVGIGSGVLGKAITWPTLVSSLVGLTTVACLWWTYFDSLAHGAALAMHGLKGDDQIALARDGYIYLHLPMIAGLILVALGGEEIVRFMAAHTANVGRPLHGLGATPAVRRCRALPAQPDRLPAPGPRHPGLDPGDRLPAAGRPCPAGRPAALDGVAGSARRRQRRPGHRRARVPRRVPERPARRGPGGTRGDRGAGGRVAAPAPLTGAAGRDYGVYGASVWPTSIRLVPESL